MEKLSDAREAIDVLTIRSHLEIKGSWRQLVGLLILQNLLPQPPPQQMRPIMLRLLLKNHYSVN